jgi:hypothetical protein
MSKAFWVMALGWVVGVVVAAPGAFRSADGQGGGLVIPGFSPLTSEFILTTAFALIPPLLAATVIRIRRNRR